MSYHHDLTEEEEIAIHEALENNNDKPANDLGIEIFIEEEYNNGVKLVNIHYNSENNNQVYD